MSNVQKHKKDFELNRPQEDEYGASHPRLLTKNWTIGKVRFVFRFSRLDEACELRIFSRRTDYVIKRGILGKAEYDWMLRFAERNDESAMSIIPKKRVNWRGSGAL